MEDWQVWKNRSGLRAPARKRNVGLWDVKQDSRWAVTAIITGLYESAATKGAQT